MARRAYNYPRSRLADPRDGSLVLSDGLHASDEGGTLIAELFRQLGYEYVPSAP